jgi:hypothetical protein
MRAWSRSILALLVVGAVLGVAPAQAGTRLAQSDGARCSSEFYRHWHYKPARKEFIVRAPGYRLGAVGVWENRSGVEVHVRVDPGEGRDSRVVPAKRHEYKLVRCETVR